MNGIVYFFWLAAQALEILVLVPPAAVMMIVGVVGAIVAACHMPGQCRRQALVAVLVPLTLPAAILACGVLFAHDTALATDPPKWPEQLVVGLLIGHLPLVVALMLLLHRARWLALSASVGAFGYSCGAAFMSTMSVSGRWL